MKLIASLTSPYARKVRVVLAEKKIDYELVIDNPWEANNQTMVANPLGKVPVLVMEDDAALFASSVIVEYLDTLPPVTRLIPNESGRARAEVRCWEALADGICDAAVAIVLERKRALAQQSIEVIDRNFQKIASALTAAEKGLGDKPWCTGIHFNLADVAIGVALFYLEFRLGEVSWRSEHQQLAKLADKLAQRASFIETQPPVA